MLVLEQCLYTQPSDGQCGESWRGIALLAMSTLLYERFYFYSYFPIFYFIVFSCLIISKFSFLEFDVL